MNQMAAVAGLFLLCTATGAAAEERLRVVFLGTGTPNADPARSGPALAIIADGEAYLVDAGPGVVRRAAAAAEKGEAALAPSQLERVFITHLHSDHTLGLPDLMLSPWVLERSAPLKAYGPAGLSAMTRNLLEAYKEDIEIRLDGLEPANTTGHQTQTQEISAGVVFREGGFAVEAFEVPHGSWRTAFGYKFSLDGRTIVVSGDTAPSEALVEAAKGADILIHEVYSATRFPSRAPEWQRYHKAFHTSTVELAEIARRAEPKLLVLYHQLNWGVADEELIAEIRAAGYDGEIASARDLDSF